MNKQLIKKIEEVINLQEEQLNIMAELIKESDLREARIINSCPGKYPDNVKNIPL